MVSILQRSAVSVMSGWGLDVFTKPNYYWWIVPVLTSHVGAVVGAWIYYLAIGREDDPLLGSS